MTTLAICKQVRVGWLYASIVGYVGREALSVGITLNYNDYAIRWGPDRVLCLTIGLLFWEVSIGLTSGRDMSQDDGSAEPEETA